MSKHTTINWILQHNLTKPKVLEQIRSALTPPTETWEAIEMIPFSMELPSINNQADYHIFYGSTTLMLTAYQDATYNKYVFYNEDNFTMSNYVKQWKDNVLNADGQLMTLGELTNLKGNEAYFIRPNADSKLFSGQLDTAENLKIWANKMLLLELPDFKANTQIWIATPKVILKEWRVFIVDDKIISASRYMRDGELDIDITDLPNDLLDFTKEQIKTYRLHDVYVMDIAQMPNGYKIIECNCFNACGFYQHNIGQIVEAINNLVTR